MAKVETQKVETNANVSTELPKITRTRKIRLSDDAKANVQIVAFARFNKAVDSIRLVGKCTGHNYEYGKCMTGDTNENQIDRIESNLYSVVETAVDSLRTGKKIAEAGITL